jgi:hypothetical protein
MTLLTFSSRDASLLAPSAAIDENTLASINRIVQDLRKLKLSHPGIKRLVAHFGEFEIVVE